MAVADRWTDEQVVNGKIKRVRNEEWGKGSRWQVRWRDADDKQRKRNHATRDAAEAHWAELQLAPRLRNEQKTVGEGWPAWQRTKAGLAEGTRTGYESSWRLHVAPTWDERRMASIRHSEVAGWVAELSASASPSVARSSLRVLSGILALAVRDGVIAADPCSGIAVPQPERRAGRALAPERVAELAAVLGRDALVVRTLAYTGVRWGELAGLQVGDLDTARSRLRVVRSVTERGGRLRVKSTKTREHRDVPVPPRLLADLSTAAEGRGRDEPLLPARRGGIRRHSRFHKRWGDALARLDAERAEQGLAPWWAGLRIHDMRHTAASLMIRSGADVKAVQRALGHATATMTLDLYGHLFDGGLDDLARRMGELESGTFSGTSIPGTPSQGAVSGT